MAKKKDGGQEIADQAIALLKQCIRDVEILGERYNWERRHCVTNGLFEIHDLVRLLDPEERKKKAEPEETPAGRRVMNGHVTPSARRLTHVIDPGLFGE